MQKYIIEILIIITIFITSCNIKVLAIDLDSRCRIDILPHNKPLIEVDNIPIIVNSDNARGNYPDNIIFDGNVIIHHGNSCLKADKVQIYRSRSKNSNSTARIVHVVGDVNYCNNYILLKGRKGQINLDTEDIDIWKGNYHILGNQEHRGKADLIKQRSKNRFTILKNGSFTSCLPNSDIWSIVGNKVKYDHEKQIVKIWNARFKFGKIPVFYSPYLQLAVGNKYRSGFLIPNIKYSSSKHFEFYLPYYWNISPNIDATIALKYIHKYNNIMLENEFRYITNNINSLLELDYLPADNSYKEKYVKNTDYPRWLLHWQYAGILNKIWYFNIDYNRISDLNYFRDFSSRYDSSKKGYNSQIFCIRYLANNFDIALSSKQFQMLNCESSINYAAKPQLDINWHKNNLGPFNIILYGQVVHFISIKNFSMPESIRLHLEPIINIFWLREWISMNTEAKILATHYKQKNLEFYNKKYNANLANSFNRILPQFKIDAKTMLERNISLAKGYTQILEPRIQYLYIPYINQNKIYNYDSSIFHYDYSGFFSDHIHSSLDHIDSVNQIKTGITTRIYDRMSVERFNISIGDIYCFNQPKIEINNIKWKKNNKAGLIVWLGDAYYRITDYWKLSGNIQYDRRINNIATGGINVEYSLNKNHLFQLNYRYINSEYIKLLQSKCKSSDNHNYEEMISQLGITANLPITAHWSFTTKYYHDIHRNKLIDQMLGLQYNSYCYSSVLGYERKLNSWDIKNHRNSYDNIISFNIELRNLNLNNNLKT